MLSDEELANGFVLACCMAPKSDLEIMAVEDYEEQLKKAELEEVK